LFGNEGGAVVIYDDVEVGYIEVICALLGTIMIGGLLSAWHLRWHPKLIGAALGALLGFALIEAVPLFT
jgi:hypothetical protein